MEQSIDKNPDWYVFLNICETQYYNMYEIRKKINVLSSSIDRISPRYLKSFKVNQFTHWLLSPFKTYPILLYRERISFLLNQQILCCSSEIQTLLLEVIFYFQTQRILPELDEVHRMTWPEQKFKSSRLIQFCIMADNLLDFLYAQLSFNIVFNVGFGALFIRKILKLDRLAQDHEVKIPKVVWIKFTIILVLIALLVLHLILAYSSSAYWLNSYANFSLTIFLQVANYTMQEYIILKQITKGNQARYLPNILYWGIFVIADIVQIVVVEMLLPSPTFSTILQLMICILNFGLLLISVIFEKRKVPSTDLITALNDLNTGKSIEDSIRHRQRIAPPNRLYVQFNKDFSVIPHNQGITCEFKLAVYVDQNASIITKTDLQFLKLQQQMIKMFPNRPEVLIPPEYNVKQPNLMKYGEERQKIFENYLLEITKTGEFIKPCLLDFLSVPNHLRSKLVYIQRQMLISKQDSIMTEQLQKKRQLFFKVTASKGKYILQNPDFLQFIINRPVSQIIQLHNKLKQQKKLTIDVLPQNPKESDIVSFFEIVVNRKSLWRSFCAWFRLDLILQNKVYNYFDPWSFGFKKITVDIVGYEIASDKEGKIHTCYLISIKPKRKYSMATFQLSTRGTTISKRYSDFCTLDKHIRKFISKNNPDYLDMLPALPPKFSPFGSKTSPKSRQMRLAAYLAQILSIEGINHCIKLLEFLQFNSKAQVSQQLSFSHGFQQEQSEPSYFNDLE